MIISCVVYHNDSQKMIFKPWYVLFVYYKSKWGWVDGCVFEKCGKFNIFLLYPSLKHYLISQSFFQIRQLILDLVKLLQSQNFKLVANINFRGAADSLFFESRLSSFQLPSPEEMFLVSLNRTDRVRVLSTNSDVVHNIGSLIQQSWSRGMQQVNNCQALSLFFFCKVSYSVCLYILQYMKKFMV